MIHDIRAKVGTTLTFLMIFILTSCHLQSQEVVDKIVAKVNEEIITLSDLHKRLEEDPKYEQIRLSLQQEEFQKAMLDQMITEKLLLARADELTITVDEDELNRQLMKIGNVKTMDELKEVMKEQNINFEDAKKRFLNEIRIQRLLTMEVYIKTEVTDTEINDLTEQSHENIEVKTRQIIIKIPEGSTPTTVEELKKKAQRAHDLLTKKEDFVKVSRDFSDAQNKDEGGDMGFIRKGWLPKNFETALFNLGIGEISDVIETEFGFYILQVIEKRTLDIDSKTLKEKVTKERENQSYKDYIDKLKAGSIIKIML